MEVSATVCLHVVWHMSVLCVWIDADLDDVGRTGATAAFGSEGKGIAAAPTWIALRRVGAGLPVGIVGVWLFSFGR